MAEEGTLDHGTAEHPARRQFRYTPVQRQRKLSRWHSRFVGLLKFVLPAIAAALMIVVALWSEFEDEAPVPSSTAIVQNQDGTVRMLNPRYFGMDEREQPFSIVARSADQAPGNENIVELNRPEAEITLKGGDWLALNADTGRYDRATNRIRLSGEVLLFRDDGFSAETSVAHIDLNGRDAWGDASIEVHGPEGEVQAEGFRIADEGATIVFTGKSRLLIRSTGGSETDE